MFKSRYLNELHFFLANYCTWVVIQAQVDQEVDEHEEKDDQAVAQVEERDRAVVRTGRSTLTLTGQASCSTYEPLASN